MNRVQNILGHLNANPTAASSKVKVPMVFSPEVATALKEGRPIVALESTIISHGMKYPDNLQTAVEVEDIVRAQGATPATIALLDGVVHIGLDKVALEKLAVLGPKVRKCSRRDLAIVIAEKGNGATTVASTSYLASLVGIPVFVTGGIGGVHRGVEETMDISADLTELGRTPIAIVCAGVKSILDIPRTLEYLETEGVSVVSVGTPRFPAFFTPDSGLDAPYSVNTATEAAAIIKANRDLALRSGTLFAVPVPASQAAASEEITQAINRALDEMKAAHVKGKDATPFLLKRVAELTQGKSLASNIALVKNNAAFGGKMAVELAKLQRM